MRMLHGLGRLLNASWYRDTCALIEITFMIRVMMTESLMYSHVTIHEDGIHRFEFLFTHWDPPDAQVPNPNVNADR